MPLPSTLTPIATNTLNSNTASITFSNIPQTYTDLVIIYNGGITTALNSISVQFNGDTAANYSFSTLEGNGTSASSARNTGQDNIQFGLAENNQNSTNIGHIQNYSNTTTYKTVLGRGNTPSSLLRAVVGLWRNTAAITSISIISKPAGYSLSSGSTITLYGVKAA